MKIKCSFCGQNSNKVAIIPYVFKEKIRNICVDCLAENVLERFGEEIEDLEELNYELDNENETDLKLTCVECENCKRILFIEKFPFTCPCGKIINDSHQERLNSHKNDK